MDGIRIVEKPETLSYDAIHELLYAAHAVNRARGFVMRTAQLSGEELEKRIGRDGKCWVAFDGDKPVGTLSIRIVSRNAWYARGKVPDYMLAAVLPEYSGRHINSMLAAKAFEYAAARGYTVMELDTADNNDRAIGIYRHQGFRPVGYSAPKGLDHYSVIMAKWLVRRPLAEGISGLMFRAKRLYTRSRYRVGGEKRFF